MSNIADLHHGLVSSPIIFPFSFSEVGDAQCLRFSESDYFSASFLDGRYVRDDHQRGVVPWQIMEQASAELSPACDFIFHISHCGSTLLSRLLSVDTDVLPLREPLILREMADGKFLDRMEVLLAYWSRIFRPSQRACIKATSFVSEIGPKLMSFDLQSKAILVYVPLESFLRGMLSGAMSDIDGSLDSRVARLRRRQGCGATGEQAELEDTQLSAGERVALSWFAEMLSLADIALAHPERVLWFDFEQFVGNSDDILNQATSHLGMQNTAERLLDTKVLSSYAKKPGTKYDVNTRNALLEKSAVIHQEEIQRGLRWAENFALPMKYSDFSVLLRDRCN